MIGEFYAKSEAILRDDVLKMKAGGRFLVSLVEQVIEAGGGIQVFDEVVAVEGEVEDGKTRRVRPRLRIAGNVGVDCMAGAGVLEFQSGKEFILPQRHADVGLDQMHG